MTPSLPAFAELPASTAGRPSARPVIRARSERLRKPVSWLALGAIVVAWPAFGPVTRPGPAFAVETLGLLAVITAMLGRVWCALYIAGRKNTELCQDGPYSLVRNPLYAFSFVGALGVALATHRPLLVPIVAGLFIAYYHVMIQAEEARLVALFPDAYPAYRQKVPRALPRFDGYRSREFLTLNPASVTRCMREVIWFPIAFAVAVALGRLA